jgi:hypothetical protein
MYGRKRSVALLREIYQNCVQPNEHDDRTRLLLLSGPTGVGKRTLAHTLEPTVESNHGLFISARVFPLPQVTSIISSDTPANLSGTLRQSPTPSVLLEAVRNLFALMSEKTLCNVRDLVLKEYFDTPSDLELLTEILASVGRFQSLMSRGGHSSVVKGYGGGDESNVPISLDTSLANPMIPPFSQGLITLSQTAPILARLVGAISTLVPLVLLVESAELANQEDLDALNSLMDPNAVFGVSTRGLLVLLSYNDDVPASIPMVDFLVFFDSPHSSLDRSTSTEQEISQSSSLSLHVQRFRKLPVTSLARKAVHQWISDWCTNRNVTELVHHLADFILDETLGNPLHLQYALCYLDSHGFPTVDNLNWLLELKAVIPKNVCELFQQVVAKQDSLVRRVMETLAALSQGSESYPVSEQMLEKVLQQPCIAALTSAQELHLLECHHGSLQFCNAKLQRAVYEMIPESNRSIIHLRIGRRLWKNSSLQDNYEDTRMLSVVTRQLQLGIDRVTVADERNMVVVLHWEAGKKAMQSGAFSCAAELFRFAISILGPDIWSADLYEISLALCNGAAEAYYCTGEFANMEHMIDNICMNAAAFHDKIQAYTTLVFANGARNRRQEACSTALEVLEMIGEPIPTNPGKARVIIEVVRLYCLLRTKNLRFFLNLPAATDPDRITAMTLLNFTSTYSYSIEPNRSIMAMIQLVRRSLEHGMTGSAVPAFSGYALFLVRNFGRFVEGFRNGQIALELLAHAESRHWLPRVHSMVYGIVNPWTRPFRESLEPLLFAHRSALKTGDIEGSSTCASFHVMTMFHAGVPLAKAEQETRLFCNLMETRGQTHLLGYMYPLLKRQCDLMGKPARSSSEAGHSSNLSDDKENQRLVAFRSTCTCAYASHSGDHHAAVAVATEARAVSSIADFSLDFYEGLSSLALACCTEGRSRCKLIRKGRLALKRMKRYAKMCPTNFYNKKCLLEAELEAICGSPLKSSSLFEESIKAAKTEGFIHEEGLAYERLAQFHFNLGHSQTSIPSLVFAREAYERWGANALVRRMDELLQAQGA